MIASFRQEYSFLSNFYPVAIEHDGLVYQSVEAAYQAAKCANPADRIPFTRMQAAEAKRAGRTVALRPDWDQAKIPVMRELLTAKFFWHPEMKRLLLNTGEEELVEGNTWGDRFWGVCNGEGDNWLGILLMQIRKTMRGGAT